MSSHYQLLTRTPNANISQCMRHLGSRYAQGLNEKLIGLHRDILSAKRKTMYTSRRRALIYILRKYYYMNFREFGEYAGKVSYVAVSKQYKHTEREIKAKNGCYFYFNGLLNFLKLQVKT